MQKPLRASEPSDAGERQDLRAGNQKAPRVYYEDEAVTLYHGDCREILPTIGMVDHVITDPPYSEETHGKTWRSKMMAEQGYQRVSAAHDGLGFEAITEEQIAAFLDWCQPNCRRWIIAFSDIEGVWRWATSLRDSRAESCLQW